MTTTIDEATVVMLMCAFACGWACCTCVLIAFAVHFRAGPYDRP